MATVERTGVGEGRAGIGDLGAFAFVFVWVNPSDGGGGVRGASEIAGASASEAPQKRQKCDVGSEPPRHLGQRRNIASDVGAPSSTTRPGAIGA
jgi:hypothetical protein